eukprot:g2809.t1
MNKRTALDIDRRVALWLSMRHVQMRVEKSASSDKHNAREHLIKDIYSGANLMRRIVTFVGSPSDAERKEQSLGLFRGRTRVEIRKKGKWKPGIFYCFETFQENWCVKCDADGSLETCKDLCKIRREGYTWSLATTSMTSDLDRKLGLRRGRTRIEIKSSDGKWHKGTYAFFDDKRHKWKMQRDEDEEGIYKRKGSLLHIRFEGQTKSIIETYGERLTTDLERKLGLRHFKTRIEMKSSDGKWHKGTYAYFDDKQNVWVVKRDEDEEGAYKQTKTLHKIRFEGQTKSIEETYGERLATDLERKLGLRRFKTRIEMELTDRKWHKGTYAFFDDKRHKWKMQRDEDEEGTYKKTLSLLHIRFEGQTKSIIETYGERLTTDLERKLGLCRFKTRIEIKWSDGKWRKGTYAFFDEKQNVWVFQRDEDKEGVYKQVFKLHKIRFEGQTKSIEETYGERLATDLERKLGLRRFKTRIEMKWSDGKWHKGTYAFFDDKRNEWVFQCDENGKFEATSDLNKIRFEGQTKGLHKVLLEISFE